MYAIRSYYGPRRLAVRSTCKSHGQISSFGFILFHSPKSEASSSKRSLHFAANLTTRRLINRITSYNVCYTKLLRTQAWAIKLVTEFDYSGDLVLRYDRKTGLPEATLGSLAGEAPGSAEET